MENRKIYPILINRNRLTDYYKMLFEKDFKLKTFSRDIDKDIDAYFLPIIKNLMFWTFDMEKQEDFDSADLVTKATMCKTYNCNIFESGKSEVICFTPGIIFVVTDEKEVIDALITEENQKTLEKINIRADMTYKFSAKSKEDEENPKFARAHLYAYILQLYKVVFLNKVNKEIVNPDTFDRTRNEFVAFTQDVFDVQITDTDDACSNWAKDLELEKLYIMVENQFDLLYKNNRLNDHQQSLKIFIALLVVLIIIGIFILWNFLAP